MGVKAADVIKKLIEMGCPPPSNQLLDADTAALLAQEYGFVVENVAPSGSLIDQEEDRAEDLRRAAPWSPSWGTSITARRRCSTPSGEQRDRLRGGGITQHIGL